MQQTALQKCGYSIIERIDSALTSHHAQYFIDCGTLLGMFRDKRLIPYDKDMDLGIWFDESFNLDKLDLVMKQAGFKKERAFVFQNEVREITYVKGLLHIDFFVHREVGNESWIYLFYRNAQKKYPSSREYSVLVQKRAHITGIKRLTIDGISMNIPENTEEYLASTYSESWRVPDPSWHYTMEPGCTHIDDEYGIIERA